jgi:regulator of protease activity HflC (stomatin/prohibitin superfamily)
LLLICKFIVIDAYLPVVELKGDFFELTGSILKGSVIDVVKDQKTIQQFLAAPKGEGGILQSLTNWDSVLNGPLGKRVGLRLVGIAIAEWDPSDPKIREAMNEPFIAEREREATLIAADAHKQKAIIEAEGDAQATERLATARGAQIRETVAQLAAASPGRPDLVVRAAAKVLQAQALPNLTTLVEDGGAQPVVPVGGNK